MARGRTFTSLGLLGVCAVVAAVMLSAVGTTTDSEAATVFCFGKKATRQGTDASETINGGPGNDVIVTFGGNDIVDGKGGIDRICTGTGNDLIKGGPANDFIQDVGGIDTLSYDKVNKKIDVNLKRGKAVGEGTDLFTGIENVIGGNKDDTINANGAANSISGGKGNDTIRGSNGADSLAGNDGNDRIFGEGGNDTLQGNAGNDLLDGGPQIDAATYAEATGAINANLTTNKASGQGTDTFAKVENLLGSKGNDTLTGNGDANTLNGDEGNDTLDGKAGNDSINGQGGNDIVLYSSGSDFIRGGSNTDGTPEADELRYDKAPGGGVVLNTSTSPQTASVPTDAGKVDNLDEFENYLGSDFADTMSLDFKNNIVSAGGGNDTVLASGGDDTLNGGDGGDTLDGGDGTDTIDGGAGTDVCIGEILTTCP